MLCKKKVFGMSEVNKKCSESVLVANCPGFLIFFFISAIYIQQSPSTTLEIQAVNSFTVTSSWKLSPAPHLLFCSIFFLVFFLFFSCCVYVCKQAMVPIPLSTHTHRFSSNLHFFSSTLFFPIAQMAFLLHDAFFFFLFILRRKKILIIKNSAGEGLSFHSFSFFSFFFNTYLKGWNVEVGVIIS